ncbi:uracil-DNA glycosylase [Sphingomonas sp. RS2018]
MGADQHHDWREMAASTLDWWRDAGVDVLVEDCPRDWTVDPAPPRAPANQPVAVAAAAPAAPAFVLPDTLDAFLVWRMGDEAPEAGRGDPVAPEGDAASDLMIVVECPGASAMLDEDSGRLFDRILAAIGRTRASVYVAALTRCRPITGRVASESEAELATILRHHVALVRPKAVLALGTAVSRALGATDGEPQRGNLVRINLNGQTVDVVASYHPRTLLDRPAMKAAAWKDLQLLMEGLR